jgi:hypothetical protein
VDGTEDNKTRAQQRAAGTKKTALFDIVNRKVAVGVLSKAPNRVSGNALVSRPSARLGAPLCAPCWYARESRDTGDPQGIVAIEVDIALRTFLAGSTQVGFTRLAHI